MRVRSAATTFSGLLLISFWTMSADPAAADDSAVLVAETDKVPLTAADHGAATASVTLQNQGPRDLPLSVATGKGAAKECGIKISENTEKSLPAHRQQKVKLTFDADCDRDRTKGTNFTLTAGTTDFPLHADPPTKPDPNWHAVGIAYLAAFVGALILLVGAWLQWQSSSKDPKERKDEKGLRMSLPGLDADWKFTDSWAANATVVTALFTGLFGAKEAANALLGEDGTTNLLAIALVSAAVSVGLAGLAPMVLQALRDRFEVAEKKDKGGNPISEEIPAGLYVTPIGLLVAALLTLTATAGQLASILYAIGKTDFAEDWLLITIGALAAALLGWYAVTATMDNLTTGVTPPPPEALAGQAGEGAQAEGLAAARTIIADVMADDAAAGRPVIAIVQTPVAVPAVPPRRHAAIL